MELKWYNYEIVSPKEDGKYQIFIDNDQLVARFDRGFGFSSIEDGCAFVQEMIKHWAELPNNPE